MCSSDNFTTNFTDGCVDVATHWHDVLVGVVMIISTFVNLTPYVMCMKVFYMDPELSKLAAYRIMFHLGLADCSNGISQLYAGISTMCQCSINAVLGKVLGGLMEYAYFLSLIFMVILALNRLFCLCTQYVDVVFGKSATIVWIVICYLYPLPLFIFFMTPLASMIYYPENYSWYYDYTTPYNWLVKQLDFWCPAVKCTMALLVYILIVIYINVKKSNMSSGQENVVKREIRIMVMALIIFLYNFFTTFIWFTAEYWLPQNKWTYFALNMTWVFSLGLNPLLYLTMIKTIRLKVGAMVGLKSSVAPALSQRSYTQRSQQR